MTKATEDDLSTLHGAVAQALTAAITDGVKVVVRGKGDTPDEVEEVPASASYFAAAITFLKNNNITAARGNAELDALKAALENRRSKPTLTPAALDEAAALFGAHHGDHPVQ
jgi:hypothetical protein